MLTNIEKSEEPKDALAACPNHLHPPTQLIDINEVELEALPDAENRIRELDTESGKIGWALLWLLGIPLPVLIIAYLIWGR